MRLKVFVFIALVFLPAAAAFSAENVYLFLYGGEGCTEQIFGDPSVTSLGRANSIECLSYSHMVAAEPDEKTGMAGTVHNHYPISILKCLDRSSPRIYTAWRDHEPLKGVFKFFRSSPSGDGTIEQFYTVTVFDVYVSAIRQIVPNTLDSSTSGLPPMERISFTYGMINEFWAPTGAETEDKWNANTTTIPLSDVNFDGIVNMKDYAILADDWMKQY